jgi:membrane-associated protease RseP (regulator of RpoE activity)
MLTRPAPVAACFSIRIWDLSMPTSPSSSIGSPERFETVSAPDTPSPSRLRWRLPALLFVLTVASILYTAALGEVPIKDEPFWWTKGAYWLKGIPFTVSLLAILLTHEFAHYLYARHHRVDTSLPMFIPLPFIGLFGTMGAVIFMRDRIKSKNALVDIGASGPLAGMAVAIPVLLYGLAHSEVKPLPLHGEQEGQSILYWLAKRIMLGPIPEGYDVFMNGVATAGWVGLFVTMLNLIPVAQLDGGHVAYALLGRRQDRYSRIVRWSMLGLFAGNFAYRFFPVLRHGFSTELLGTALSASLPWFGWFFILSLLERASGGRHPPTEPAPLSPARRVVAIGTLVLFILLFMPTPWMSY